MHLFQPQADLTELLATTTPLTSNLLQGLDPVDKAELIESMLQSPRLLELRVRTASVFYTLLQGVDGTTVLCLLYALLHSDQLLANVIPNAAELASFCKDYPVITQDVLALLLTSDSFRSHYLKTCRQVAELVQVAELGEAVIDWLLEDPERFAALNPTVTALTSLQSRQQYRFEEFCSQVLQSPECLAYLFRHPRDLQNFCEKFPGYQVRVIETLLEHSGIFHQAFPTAEDLVKLTAKYPALVPLLTVGVMTNPAQFHLLFSTVMDLRDFTNAFPQYREQCLANLFDRPWALYGVFNHINAVQVFVISFPDLQLDLLQRLTNDHKLLSGVVTDTLAFLALLDLYPEHQASLIQQVLADEILKFRVVGVSFECFRIGMRLNPSMRELFRQTVMRDEALVMHILKSDLDLGILYKEVPLQDRALVRLLAKSIVSDTSIVNSCWRLDRFTKMSPLIQQVYGVQRHDEIVPAATRYLQWESEREIRKNVCVLFKWISDDLAQKIAVETRDVSVHTKDEAHGIARERLASLRTCSGLKRSTS